MPRPPKVFFAMIWRLIESRCFNPSDLRSSRRNYYIVNRRKLAGCREKERWDPEESQTRNQGLFTDQYSTSGRIMSPSLKTGNHAAATMLTSSVREKERWPRENNNNNYEATEHWWWWLILRFARVSTYRLFSVISFAPVTRCSRVIRPRQIPEQRRRTKRL